MNKRVLTAAVVWVGAVVLLTQAGSITRAQSATPSRASSQTAPAAPKAAPAQSATAARAQSATPAAALQSPVAAEAAKQRAWLNQVPVSAVTTIARQPQPTSR